MKLKKKLLIVVIYALILTLSIVGGFALRNFIQSPFENAEGHVELSEIEETNGKEKINLLVMGVDKTGGLCDVVMVVRYDEEHNKMMAMSIPRDTYVTYNGGTMLINSVYGYGKSRSGDEAGGINAIIKSVTALTGLNINYYVQFDVGTFAKVVDALGGVEFDVPQNMDYEDPVQDLSIHIKRGKQVLNGEDAEGLVRFRATYIQGDLKRVEVQQDLLKALIQQKLNTEYITSLPSVYSKVKDDVKCNMTLPDMLKYGKSMLKLDTTTDIYTCTMPTTSAHDAHLYQDRTETDKVLKQYFYTDGIL